jgi:hypothetical protein
MTCCGVYNLNWAIRLHFDWNLSAVQLDDRITQNMSPWKGRILCRASEQSGMNKNNPPKRKKTTIIVSSPHMFAVFTLDETKVDQWIWVSMRGQGVEDCISAIASKSDEGRSISLIS